MDFAQLLEAAFVLSGATKTPADTKGLGQILSDRLDKVSTILGADRYARSEAVQPERETALCALMILENVQHILDEDESRLIGTRDLAQLRTLLSIVFKWYIDPESEALYDLADMDPHLRLRGTDLGSTEETLTSGVSRLWRFIFPPHSVASSSSSPSTSTQAATRTHITQTLVSRHLDSLLRPSLLLTSLHPDSSSPIGSITAHASSLISLLPSSQTILALGAAMAPRPGAKKIPAATRALCSSMLGQQLLREDGISGLFAAIFGDGEGVDEAPLAKLEHVSHLLITPPQSLSKEEYYATIVPRVIEILAPSSVTSGKTARVAPAAHRRAASFTISRLMGRRATAELVTPILRDILCKPFLSMNAQKTSSQAIALLTTLLVNADPSPVMIHLLLSPIIVPLYALAEFLDNHRGAILNEPLTRELGHGLITTWARVVRLEEAIKGWWAVIQGVGGWGLDEEAENTKEWTIQKGEPTLQLRSVSDLPILTTSAQDPSDIGLHLRPGPSRLVAMLKELNKKEITGALFIRCLDEYSVQDSAGRRAHPLRLMLLLNTVLEMIENLDSSILSDVQHILSFIAHTIEPAPKRRETAPQPPEASGPRPLRLDDLRIIDSDDEEEGREDEAEGADSDDETDGEGEAGVDGGGGIISTALNLLLAILEGNPDLTPSSTPLLSVIFSRLEPLTDHSSDYIRKTALEARLVITTRNAAGVSGSGASKPSPKRRLDHEVYQEALKLVQDPILPVRAHGLLMLRQLIVPPRARASTSTSENVPSAGEGVDPALVPAILDVFMQSVQDDDSFVFLNAVQGLSAMVDRLGRSILSRLMDVYSGGLEHHSVMLKTELDKRLRVGEALVQVVRRCGDALPVHVDAIAPLLLRVVRSPHMPTNLRSSALSILATCIEVSPVALLPWTDELVSGMTDLLQVETVSFPASKAATSRERESTESIRDIHVQGTSPASGSKTGTSSETEADHQGREKQSTSTANPHRAEDVVPALTVSTKAPALRRSALHFLSLLLQAFVLQTYDDSARSSSGRGAFTPSLRSRLEVGSVPTLESAMMQRLGTVARYVRDTDVDGIVRAQASECADLLGQLVEAQIGIGQID